MVLEHKRGVAARLSGRGTLLALLLFSLTEQTRPAAESLSQELCGGKPGCRAQAGQPAGVDAGGRTIQIVELSIDNPKSDTDAMRGCQPHRRQFWRILQQAKQAPTRKLLLDLCNDGYGSAGIGGDDITVGANRLIHEQTGGSSWRWHHKRVVQLSPLQLLTETRSEFWNIGDNEQTAEWDFVALKGLTQGYVPYCQTDGHPPSPTDDETKKSTRGVRYQYAPIPQLQEPPKASFAEVGLGSCALSLDSSGAGGFIVHGDAGAPGDAQMKVLLLGKRELVIEVRDDVFSYEAADWVLQDHLELWLGRAVSFGNTCIEKQWKPQQWGIRLKDGRVFAGYGKPERLPTVKRWDIAGGKAVRLHIAMPPLPDGEESHLTVVYSDTDDGKRQERLIATSDLKFGSLATLGGSEPILQKHGTCTVQSGLLQFTPAAGDSLDLESD